MLQKTLSAIIPVKVGGVTWQTGDSNECILLEFYI